MGEEDSFAGWDDYVNSKLSDDGGMTRESFLNPVSGSEDAPTNANKADNGLLKTIGDGIGNAIGTANNFVKENVGDRIENALEDTPFGKVKEKSGGGGNTGKPARIGYHTIGGIPICVENAITQCPFGMTFCTLRATPFFKPATVAGFMDAPALTIYDHWAFENVGPPNLFTLCQNPLNPYVIWATALATAAKGGVFTFTPWPCSLSIPLFSYVQPSWVPMQGSVLYHGMPVLTQNATISCWFPAQLSIAHCGQGISPADFRTITLGPGGLAGIENIANMAASVFSVGGGFSGVEVMNKISAGFDVFSGMTTIANGDIIGGTIGVAMGGLGLSSSDFAVNRAIKKTADFTGEILNRGVKKLYDNLPNTIRRNLQGSLSPGEPQRLFNSYMDNADRIRENANGVTTSTRVPSAAASNPQTAASRKQQKAQEKAERIAQAEKRTKAAKEVAEYNRAMEKVNRNPAVTPAEKAHLDDLKQKRADAESKLNRNKLPTPEEERRLVNLQDSAIDAKNNLKNHPAPTNAEKNNLEKMKNAKENAEAEMRANTVSDEEMANLEQLRANHDTAMKKMQEGPTSLENLENERIAQEAFDRENARITEKRTKYEQAKKDVETTTKDYNTEKDRLDKKQQEHDDAALEAQRTEELYNKELNRQDNLRKKHKEANDEYNEANQNVLDEQDRQTKKDKAHKDAQAAADAIRPDDETFELGLDELSSGNMSGIVGKAKDLNKGDDDNKKDAKSHTK